MIRRLVFVSSFIFVAAFALLRWIVTGKSGIDFLQRFEEWGLQ